MAAPDRHPDDSSPPARRATGGSEARVGDLETRAWLDGLAPGRPDRDRTLAALHDLLLRAARAELARRWGRHSLTGPELEDLAYQAAHDAMLAIVTKLGEFRGESRFTTWAYKFVIFEVSNQLGRHLRRRPTYGLDGESWDRLPERLGVSPEQHAVAVELVEALREAVAEELTEHQRQVFLALFVRGVPLDALADELRSNRNAIYKTMFDARRKLRAALVAKGHMDSPRGQTVEDGQGRKR